MEDSFDQLMGQLDGVDERMKDKHKELSQFILQLRLELI